MEKRSETKTSSIRLRQKPVCNPVDQSISSEKIRRSPFQAEHLLKNMGVAAALVLCAVALRTGSLPALDPAADVVLTAATDNSLLDDQLGKLSFVSALFPEAVLVFGEQSSITLEPPVRMEQVTHAWTEQEPYTAWEAGGEAVVASADGEVTGVYHGNGEEKNVWIKGKDGMTCIYGNIKEAAVRTGDAVNTGDLIGHLLPGKDFVFEVQKNGISVDPTIYLSR